MSRPDYCPDMPDESLNLPCPACGAMPDGSDPTGGVCQARYPYPRPKPLVELVLIDKETNEIVARTS